MGDPPQKLQPQQNAAAVKVSLQDLKAARDHHNRQFTRALSEVRLLLAEDDPDQLRALMQSRQNLIDCFHDFNHANSEYYDMLVSEPETDPLKLESEQDFLLAEQNAYSSILEKIRERLGYDRDVTVTRHVKEIISSEIETDSEGNPTPNPFSTFVESMNRPITALLDSMNRPKVILEVFDGSPSRYHEFIKSYDLAMGGCEDFGYMLTILNQYASDEPKRDIKGCLKMSDPKKGYEAARKILDEKYGDPCTVAHKIVENLRKGGPVSTAAEIKALSADLNDALLTLKEIEMLEKMMSQPIIKEIILRLPMHLCRKWQSFSVKKRVADKSYPEFESLCKFVKGHSEILSDEIFGEKFLNEKSNQSDPTAKQNMQRNEKLTGYSTSMIESSDLPHDPVDDLHSPPSNLNAAYSTSGLNARYSNAPSGVRQGPTFSPSISQYIDNSGLPVPECPLCTGIYHLLFHCEKFKKMTPADRFVLIQKTRLCFNCFREGHISKSCTKKSLCNVPGCNRKHSTWIHIPDNSINLGTYAAHDDLLMNENAAPLSNLGQTLPGNDSSAPELIASRQQNSMGKRVDFKVPRNDQLGSPQVQTQSTGSSESSGDSLDSEIKPVMCTGTHENMQYKVSNGSYLPIVRVLVNGKYPALIGLDSMSSNTLCSEKFARIAGLPKGPMLNSMHMATAMGSMELKNNDTVSMTLQDMDKTNEVHLQNVPTLPIPIVVNKGKNDIDHYEHLRDLEFSVPEDVSEIDILIGVDYSAIMCPLEVFKGKKNEPYATLTMFGTVLHGQKVTPNLTKSAKTDKGEPVLVPSLVTMILPDKRVTNETHSAPDTIRSERSHVSSIVPKDHVSNVKDRHGVQVSAKSEERATTCQPETNVSVNSCKSSKLPLTISKSNCNRIKVRPDAVEMPHPEPTLTHNEPKYGYVSQSLMNEPKSHVSLVNDETSPRAELNPLSKLYPPKSKSPDHTALSSSENDHYVRSSAGVIDSNVRGGSGFNPVVSCADTRPPDMMRSLSYPVTRYRNPSKHSVCYTNYPPD